MFLVFIGFLAIFSATAPKCMREGANLATFLVKQMVYAGVGFFAMGFFAKFDYKNLKNITLNSCGQLLFYFLYYNSHRSVL